MDKSELIKLFFQWFVPFVCATGVASLIAPAWHRYKKGRQLELQREWNDCAKDAMKQIEIMKNEFKKKDVELETKMNALQDTLLKKIEANTAGIRQAILQSHLRELVIDAKFYIQQGYITLDQLTDYEDRYLTYKSLGGNGHAEPWIKKIRELPNNPPKKE